MKKPIHQYSFWHGFLRRYVDIYLSNFYGKITVIGKENLPKNEPVILAINHQNALMDALTVISAIKGPLVFMARSDIFKNQTTAKILRFFKILPIYRIRDGIQSLQNNDAVFNEAVATLQDKKRLAILPEGNHFGQRRLRILKKGIARIAFQAEDKNNFELGLKIIPVGLDYSHYIRFGSDLLVHFGTPFTITHYKEEYKENPQKAMNAFMQELREKMIPHMLNIDDEANYESIEMIKDLYINYLKKSKAVAVDHFNLLKKSQHIADQLISLKEQEPDTFAQIAENASEIKKLLSELNLRPWVLTKKRYSISAVLVSWMLQIITLPVFIFGILANILPFYLPVYFARKVKDPQFLSSFRFVIAILTFTLFYLIYLIILLILISNKLISVGIWILIPITGIISYKYYVWCKKTIARFRNNQFRRNKNHQWIELHQEWDQFVDLLQQKIG